MIATTYKSSRLVRFPNDSGMVPVKLFAEIRLQGKLLNVNNIYGFLICDK